MELCFKFPQAAFPSLKQGELRHDDSEQAQRQAQTANSYCRYLISKWWLQSWYLKDVCDVF